MASKPAIHVILVPGADDLPFAEDIAHAEARGHATHPLTPEPITGHPVDARIPYYQREAAALAALADAIRGQDAGARVFGIGRNRGGSLLAFAAAHGARLDGLVLTGAIPELSRFRATSSHISARLFRAGLEKTGEVERIAELRELDMTVSLEAIAPETCLIQVGTEDPWMDADCQEAFAGLEPRFTLTRLPDGHAMAAPATVAERWAFIERLAGRDG